MKFRVRVVVFRVLFLYYWSFDLVDCFFFCECDDFYEFNVLDGDYVGVEEVVGVWMNVCLWVVKLYYYFKFYEVG